MESYFASNRYIAMNRAMKSFFHGYKLIYQWYKFHDHTSSPYCDKYCTDNLPCVNTGLQIKSHLSLYIYIYLYIYGKSNQPTDLNIWLIFAKGLWWPFYYSLLYVCLLSFCFYKDMKTKLQLPHFQFLQRNGIFISSLRSGFAI